MSKIQFYEIWLGHFLEPKRFFYGLEKFLCINFPTLSTDFRNILEEVVFNRLYLISKRRQQVPVGDHTQRHDLVQNHPGCDLVVLNDGREVFPKQRTPVCFLGVGVVVIGGVGSTLFSPHQRRLHSKSAQMGRSTCCATYIGGTQREPIELLAMN